MSDALPTLPFDFLTWQDAVKKHDLVGQTVHTAELASASKMTYEQFLLLRILWITHLGIHRFRLPPVLEPHLIQANKLLAESQSWTQYCKSIKAARTTEGSFAIARHYQIKADNTKGHLRPDSFDTPIAMRTRSHTRKLEQEFKTLQLNQTPTKAPTPAPQITEPEKNDDDDSIFLEGSDASEESEASSIPVTPAALISGELHRLMFPPTKDEQIVNTALVVFLNALTIHFDVIAHCDWTLHRKAFTVQFEAAKYEARTDGYLDDGRENPWALIEVKPVTRAQFNQGRIQIQEGSQMSGWIKEEIDAPLDKLRVHVSQNRHEIFITVAEYDSGYISYLRKKPADDEPLSFLTMHQYGPWNTNNAGHMKKLGPILLALTLYADAEVKKAELLNSLDR
ncbi:hypothetical protein P170DRAFT_513116 [Aspergillus steynii IBT 23096]|uniref:Uncharacterized protein n=1 Tax=Aspergillus steynii IBT 23096 TaxID=1392250 RepID=A0A2I2FWL9_9EURO|nr:uncharacterized protein P170DRAFT_513116 [Aspergillus steynii IBT 23096]PLB45039.1 hypothetical protein P170DRAFT_513116 [Aspergillus steynii IBT 23096]